MTAASDEHSDGLHEVEDTVSRITTNPPAALDVLTTPHTARKQTSRYSC